MKTDIPIQPKIAAFFAVSLLLVSAPAFAQITITSDQFVNVFVHSATSSNSDSYTDTSAVGLQPIVLQSGANQTWNFQGLPFTQDPPPTYPSTVVAYPGGAAEASQFTGATHVQIQPAAGGITTYGFVKIGQTGYYVLGTSQDNNGTPSVTMTFTPPLKY